MKRYHFGLIAGLLLAALAVSPVAGGSNDTWDQSYYLTHAEHLAGKKDISQYNPPFTPVPIQTMNETTARLYPNMTVFRPAEHRVKSSCLFPFMRCDRFLTLTVVYNVNATHPDQIGPIITYGPGGWPMQNPVYVIPAGTLNGSQPVYSPEGMVP